MENDVYAISARIENHIASADMSLTSSGRILCNMYTLFLKELYDFADVLPKQDGNNLKKILNRNESLPYYVIKLVTPKVEEDEI